MTISDGDKLLHLFFLGSGIGESIVLRFPDGRWGVVDCYAPTRNDPATHPTLKLLRQLDVKRLEFVCLTHPHEDHYRGMAQLLVVSVKLRT